MHPAISTADLLRAFTEIRPKTDDEKRTIAAMLGFEWQPLSAAPADHAPPVVEPAPPPPDPPARDPPVPPPQAPQRDGARRKAGGGIRISAARSVPRPQLDWLTSVEPLPPGPLGRAHDPAPLFRPQWTRAILSASLSARRPYGAPDIARAVEAIARGQALKTLPRLPIMSMARGVQALLDVGEGMQPFSHDRAVLRRDLKRIVGDGSLDVLQCAGSPRKTRRDDRGRAWLDYETRFPPQLDACVLIVSDFGIGIGLGLAGGASPYTWAVLARRLARAGHRVVGFVPYPPARWPAVLSRAIDLVQWDRTASVGRISLSRARSTPA
jgi:hypothetical protein